MEIKKGISQMAEYPNVEINYVVPKNGNMYYVMKDGILDNGVIIATLDPRHAIDEKNECASVGAFSESGNVIIDFDKKDIKRITDDLLLAVSSKPTADDVIINISKKHDEFSRNEIEENKNNIINKLMNEMGPDGEIIYSDPYNEVNVYSTDSYNNKLGIDCSFVGKNKKGLYFQTNNIISDSKFIRIEEFNENEGISEIVPTEETISVPDVEEVIAPAEFTDTFDSIDVEDLNLELDQSVIDSFEMSDTEIDKITTDMVIDTAEINVEEDEEDNKEEENEVDEITSEDIEIEMNEDVDEEEEISDDDKVDNPDDEVFDNAIDVIDKLINETNKLNDRIKELEEEIEMKNKLIEEQEEKKDELNDVLSKANEILENIK